MEKIIREVNENATCWYAVYVAARAEKKMIKRLEQAGFDSYLPLQAVTRMWNGHQRRVMVPIIPGFVFVCLPEGEVAKLSSIVEGGLLLKENGEYVSISVEQFGRFHTLVVMERSAHIDSGSSQNLVEELLECCNLGSCAKVRG